MRLLGTAVLAAGLLAAAAFAGVGRPEEAQGVQAASPATRGITTSGTGSVETVPDRASFSFGVETNADSAKDALAANATRMQRVIDALLGAGIDADDIRTSNVSVNPRYADDDQAVTGYSATNSVQVEIRELDRAGAIVDTAATAGANQVWGPSLSRSNRIELVHDAMRKAVANARAKAEVLADAAGVSLGGAVRIVEGPVSQPPMPYADRAASLSAADFTPIQPGKEEVHATVTVTYDLS